MFVGFFLEGGLFSLLFTFSWRKKSLHFLSISSISCCILFIFKGNLVG